MDAEIFDSLPGGAELRLWFGGHVPSFHDAEVLSIAFDREGPACMLKVHAFQMTREAGQDRRFVFKNHAVVTFRIEGVTGMELDEFNHQNALMGLRIVGGQTKVFGGEAIAVLRIELDPAYGVGGFVEGRTLSVSYVAGIPSGSQYEKRADPG